MCGRFGRAGGRVAKAEPFYAMRVVEMKRFTNWIVAANKARLASTDLAENHEIEMDGARDLLEQAAALAN